MRAVSRFLKREYATWRQRGRCQSLKHELQADLGFPVDLRRGGSRGRDDVFFVVHRDDVIGVVRLVNPFLHGKPLPPHMPFQTIDDTARLEREWACYERGSHHGLTPAPLWRTHDAMLCSFIEGQRLSDKLAANPDSIWALMIEGTRSLYKLHGIGLTHMDASLANMLRPTAQLRESCVMIDFEYVPHNDLSKVQQQVYDYLRLLESTYKFIPADQRANCQDWIRVLEDCIDDEHRSASLAPLAPALGRILGDQALTEALAQVFHDRHTLQRPPSD